MILGFLHMFINERWTDQFREVSWTSFLVDPYTLKLHRYFWLLATAGVMCFTPWLVYTLHSTEVSAPSPHLVFTTFVVSQIPQPIKLVLSQSLYCPTNTWNTPLNFCIVNCSLFISQLTSLDFMNNILIKQKESYEESSENIEVNNFLP